MKLSISVPDQLWASAVEACRPETGPSLVVQRALTSLVGGASTRAEAPTLPKELERAAALHREVLRARVRELFELGYLRGVQLATQISWEALSFLVKVGDTRKVAQRQLDFDMGGGREPYMPEGLSWPALCTALDQQFSEDDGEPYFASDPTSNQGLDAALADFRDSVLNSDD